MPSAKIPRRSTDTDMTPFVDIAFLILSFFIMATKFKPPEPVEIKTPGSVLSQKLPENNAVMISIDSANRVYFTVLSDKDPSKYDAIIRGINTSRNLGLSEAQMARFHADPKFIAKLRYIIENPDKSYAERARYLKADTSSVRRLALKYQHLKGVL